jgi:GTP-binding protein HflX
MTRPRAVLVGVLVPERAPEELDASLDELARLCDTLGFDEVARITQRRMGTGSANVLGDGKLQELGEYTGQFGEERRADLVVVDHELSPSQLRNLKNAAGVEVLDRNGVIIEIFSGRARTREARLQVEIARLTYLAPRLRELGGPSERQAGRGAGETALQLDKRRIRDRLAELRRELAEIEEERGAVRHRRADARQVALVGYTNAGKSSLMRALTGAEPYVADQLFATLDTTVRRLSPEATPAILVTDTVGFIKDLPHSLVASFRSTLDAALDAGLLLHVVDASDPSWPQQEQVTAEVLAEINAGELPRVLVFNKCDRLEPAAIEALRAQRPGAWFTSAHVPELVAQVHQQIVEHFQAGDPEFDLFVPWARSSVLGQIRAEAHVLDEAFEADGVRYRLRAPPAAAARLQSLLA